MSKYVIRGFGISLDNYTKVGHISFESVETGILLEFDVPLGDQFLRPWDGDGMQRVAERAIELRMIEERDLLKDSQGRFVVSG